MEDWQLDSEWLRIRHMVADALGKTALPNLNAILLLIGIQEYGYRTGPFTKEEKQDLMHVATCELMSTDGYYNFIGRDEEGWPHYESGKPFTLKGVDAQANYLKKKVIEYFDRNENDKTLDYEAE